MTRFTPESEVTFERETRDCPANDRLGNGAGGGRFIYDFRVIVDGEHVATFKKITVGNRQSFGAYQLFDSEGRPIHDGREGSHWPKHFGVPVETQKDFESCIRAQLMAERIPPRAAQLAETARLAAVDSALKAECEDIAAHRAAEPFATRLLEALEACSNRNCDLDKLEDSQIAAADLIGETRAAMNAARNGEREFRQIYLGARR